MRMYRRVTMEDRIQIKSYLDAGLNQTAIADKLDFDKSTISRELSRNTGARGYRFKQAQQRADRRQEWRSKRRKLTKETTKIIDKLLKSKWSPEQISARLVHEGVNGVSYETIYQHVYRDYKTGGSLFTNLRFCHRQRKPRFPRKNKDRRGVIQGATSIDKRPSGANNRSRFGHWERDTMLGSNRSTAVLAIVDRKSRLVKLEKLKRKTAKNTEEATVRALKGQRCLSITNDRGKEFSDHKRVSKCLGVNVYFCHPYTSSERGTCENRIGVIRQYLPKGQDLKYLKNKTLKKIEHDLNNRPMKCLDWKTPYEVAYGKSVALCT